MTIHTHRRLTKSEQLGKLLIAQHEAEIAALAEPRPAKVTLAHFLLRNMNDDLAAGRCTVTCAHRIFASAPRLNVTQVRYRKGNSLPFIIVTEGNHEWQTYSGLEQLTVTWHDAADGWDHLSTPMRFALRFLAGDGGHKPRWNTLRALQQRGHVINGHLTPSAAALYAQHRQEFALD